MLSTSSKIRIVSIISAIAGAVLFFCYPKTNFWPWWCFGSIIVFVGTLFVDEGRCEKCHAWFTKQRIKEVEIGRKNTTMRKDVETKRYRGRYPLPSNQVQTDITRIDVPAIQIQYRRTYRCSKCGYTFTRIETETREKA